MFPQFLCILVLLVIQIHSFHIEVKIKQGKLIGTTEETVFGGRLYNAFYGVPYAQPPVGKLRFKNPKQPKKWKSEFDATTEYHGACAQAQIAHKYAIYGVEDCLYMNIYAPKLTRHADLKPVLVYVNGYAFASSMSHIYGGDFFIDHDIVFISVAHRIGVFGFLKLNNTDSHVNMGLKDIVMALKWIKKNIKQFGGDKNKITVMGNDSGATFLSLLLMTKHRKLFSKIILQSGAIFSPSLFQGNHTIEKQRLEHKLRKSGVKDISNATTREIITAAQKIYSSKEYINFQKPVVPFTPILETKSNKSLLYYSPADYYEKFMDEDVVKSMIIGFNSRESISELIPFIHNTHYLKYFASHFKFMTPYSDGCVYNYTSKTYNEIGNKIKSHYFKHSINESSLEDFLLYTTDLKIYPIWKFIQTYLQTNKTEMYVYKFNYVGRLSAVKATSVAGVKFKVKGSSNGDELCYILKCEPLWENYVKINNDTSNPDRIFINEFTNLWANFVKTGKPTPNSQSGIMWQPMTAMNDNILHLGKVTKIIKPKIERNMYLFWDNLYKTLHSKDHCVNKRHDEL